MDWSLHWLAGHQSTWLIREQRWHPLTDRPLQQGNSHAHRKNHPHGLQECLQYMDSTPMPADTTIYCGFRDDESMAQQQRQITLAQLMTRALERGWRVIMIESEWPIPGVWDRALPHRDIQTLRDRLSHLLPDRPDLGHMEPWQLRDYVAFNMKYLMVSDRGHMEPAERRDLASHPRWHSVSHGDWILRGDHVIQQVAEQILPQRWTAWRRLHQQWSQSQRSTVAWVRDLSDVMTAIRHDRAWDLRPYDMDLVREAHLQYEFMRCGQRLRTRGMDQLPTDTRSLHRLLK